ncbi:MAG TPA: wax ester/triacylglycerol synthase domain-containing protein, partial [Acidimicrobiales bacterium]
MSTPDRLTTLDASFLWFEHPGAPVHVGAVATFEAAPLLDEHGDLRLDDLRRRTAARLDALPRLRRRLAPVPYELDRPQWVDDPDFDIAHHLKEVRAPAPGDDGALRRVAEEILSALLPRDRPLWDLHLVTGLDGDRVALVERIHHALVDGVSGVDLAAILLDLEPDAPPVPLRPWTPEPG